MKKLNDPKEYLELFPNEKKKKAALKQAWKNRDFEIQMYWRRATYFWAFIAATFTAYYFVLTNHPANKTFQISLLVMGFLLSIAWYFVNIGSKKWQENWEYHIDLLEDTVTGSIYKTTLIRNRPSVSKVNQRVSFLTLIYWFYLLLDKLFFTEFKLLYTNLNNLGCKIFFLVIVVSACLYLFGYHLTLWRKIKAWIGKEKPGFEFELRPANYKKKMINDD